jgi:hypothetical protein
MKSPSETERLKKAPASERLIIFTVPPPATLRDQDATDLAMFQAGLEWREGAGLSGPDEFGPLSGHRWHIVLERFLSEAPDTDKKSEAAELEFLVRLLERTCACRPETDRLWADILRRFIRDDYDVPTGRPKQEVRDRLVSRHYWLVRRIYPHLHEDDCADTVAKAVADAGSKLSASRVKRIAKSAENRKTAVEWIEEQIKAFPNHAPELVVRAHLATFEPIAADIKFMEAFSRHEVK